MLGELGDFVAPVGHGVLEVLADLLGILLDLSSIGSHMLVHAVDLRVGLGRPRAGGTLPGVHSKTEVVSLLFAVGVDHAEGLVITSLGTGLTAVGKVGLLGEPLLGLLHSAVQVVAALLGVHSHVVKHLPAETGTSGSIESEVTSHLGTDSCNVSLPVGNFVADLLLDVVEVVDQAHAAIGGLGIDLSGLEHISAADRGTGVVTVDGLVHVLIAGIGG